MRTQRRRGFGEGDKCACGHRAHSLRRLVQAHPAHGACPDSSQQRVRRRGYTVPALHAAADPAPPASAAMPSLGPRIIELRLQQRISTPHPSSCHATASAIASRVALWCSLLRQHPRASAPPPTRQLGPGCRTQPAHAGHLHAAHRTQQPGSAGGHETPLRPPRALPAAQAALLVVAEQGIHARQRRCAGHGSPKNCV